MSFNHPAHPAFVHFPIAFLATAYTLDVLLVLLPHLPPAVGATLPPTAELARIAYYALMAGVATGVPAAATGVAQAVAIMGRQGRMTGVDGRLTPKVRTLFLHAGANDAVLLASGWHWWTRRAAGGVASMPLPWMAGLSAVLGVGLFVAGNLGAVLTYNYGAGMSIAKGKSKET